MNFARLRLVAAALTIASVTACSGGNGSSSPATAAPTVTPVPTSTSTPTPAPTGTAVPTNSPAPTNTPVPTSTPTVTPAPTSTPTVTPAPTSTPTPTPTVAAKFTGGSGYNGLASSIAILDTVEAGGTGNVQFDSIPHGQTGSGNAASPNRLITLEINDNTRISNSSTYTSADFNGFKVLAYYAEDLGASANGRYWIATGGTVTFENVGNGAATYRLRGVTFTPNQLRGQNAAVGSFTLDAVGTANPYTSN